MPALFVSAINLRKKRGAAHLHGSHQIRTCQAGDQIQLFLCMLMRVGIGREKTRGTKIGKLKIAQRTRLSPKRGRVKLMVNVSSLLCIRFKKGR